MATLNLSLKYALKEWAIAVEALTKGETIVLLRKGGIRERGFKVEHPQFWLYPTYEHQKPHLLAPQYAPSVTEVPSGWHPETVSIQSCAQITQVLPVSSQKRLMALQPYHVWNEQMIRARLKWKQDTPLLVLLLRVYRLAQPETIPFVASYGGCKSWIALEQELASRSLTPVLSEAEYLAQTQTIEAALSE